MFADIDHSHPEVRSEFFKWAEWLNDQMLLGGLRLDAVKHISRGFVQELVAHFERLRDAQNKPPWFVVGEYFSDEVSDLDEYLEALDHRIRLFDVPLLKNFSRISFEPRPDLRTIFDGTLCASNPDNAVVRSANCSQSDRGVKANFAYAHRRSSPAMTHNEVKQWTRR